MRYADYQYSHAVDHGKEARRAAKLETAAKNNGFESAADYIDFVQGHKDTRSFDGDGGRRLWGNPTYKLAGVNHSQAPAGSTAFIKNSPENWLKNKKLEEASRLRLEPKDIKELGPIPESRRLVITDQKVRLDETRKEATQKLEQEKADAQKSDQQERQQQRAEQQAEKEAAREAQQEKADAHTAEQQERQEQHAEQQADKEAAREAHQEKADAQKSEAQSQGAILAEQRAASSTPVGRQSSVGAESGDGRWDQKPTEAQPDREAVYFAHAVDDIDSFPAKDQEMSDLIDYRRSYEKAEQNLARANGWDGKMSDSDRQAQMDDRANFYTSHQQQKSM